MGGSAGVETVSAERFDGERSLSCRVLPTAVSPVHIPPALVPYEASGCAPNSREALRLVGVGAAGEERFVAQASCVPRTAPAQECPQILDPSKSPATTGADGETCIRWNWTSAADAFRAEIRYPSIAEAYAFVVDGERATFLLPHDAAPRLFESGQRCKERKDFVILVFAMRSGLAEEMVAYGSVSSECSIAE